MSTVYRDLRYGLRLLARSPAFTLVAVTTVAVAIAANTTVFSWIDSVLLRPLPGTAEGERLVVFELIDPGREGFNISYPDFRDFRDNLKLSSVAVSRFSDVLSLGEGEHAQRVWAELVSGNYFEVMGVEPFVGRFFLPEEQGDAPEAAPIAVVSERLWRNRLGADRLRPLVRQDWKPEVLGLGSRAAYLWCPAGMTESRLAEAVGRVLGEATTTRN